MTALRVYVLANFISQQWKDSLQPSMEAAAAEERRIAIETGRVDMDGVPYVRVIVDCGWSSRSHGHNYNAMSGVAVIIGFQTKKLLFVGVRNKFCVTCAKNPENTPNHLCFKNWSGPSTAMEADI